MGTRVEKIQRADGVIQGYHVGGDTVPVHRVVGPDEDVRALVRMSDVADRVNAAKSFIGSAPVGDVQSPAVIGGVHRDEVWANSDAASSYGDDAVGAAYEDRYHYQNDDGSHTVTTYGYYVSPVADETTGDISFGVTERKETLVCTDLSDIGGTELSSDYEYETADYRAFDTLEEAEAAAVQAANMEKRWPDTPAARNQ